MVLGKTPRRDHLEQLQSVSRYRMEGFPLCMPIRARAATLQHPELTELETKR